VVASRVLGTSDQDPDIARVLLPTTSDSQGRTWQRWGAGDPGHGPIALINMDGATTTLCANNYALFAPSYIDALTMIALAGRSNRCRAALVDGRTVDLVVHAPAQQPDECRMSVSRAPERPQLRMPSATPWASN